MDFANLRIYGLLTDLVDFHFYSYDPLRKQFAFDETMTVNITRDVAFTDMIPGMCFLLLTYIIIIDQTYPVCNKIFGVILTAYIDGLEATLRKSTERGNEGDVSYWRFRVFWRVLIAFVDFIFRLRASSTNGVTECSI